MRIKKEVILLVIVLGLLGSVEGKSAEKVDSAVLEELENNETVRVIVSIQEDDVRKGLFGFFRVSSEDYRKEIIEEIGKDKVGHEFSAGNSFSAELSEKEINRLVEDGAIERVNYDYPVRAFLQDSKGIVSANLTWARRVSGFNLTGINETVCIIDSGINYTHPDLGGCFGTSCKILGGYDFVNDDSDPRDDNGHGTHVAGIVAANGSILGIAPDARLISIKSLDENGDGVTSDLVAGIDWCVGNSSSYNIGVISMSLGTTTLYEDYCDSDFPSLTSAINTAIGNDILVVAATGNSGGGVPRNTTAIASPACIQNATSVSATDKDDSIASYAHYNSLVDLFAPGTSINSTRINGLYLVDSGTSMATPHVSGAIALIKQYLRLTGQSKTAGEIESELNNTGKRISDGNLNFSRINTDGAVIAFDADMPNVTLISPLNNTSSVNVNQTFNCNATDLALKNVTFYLWNSTDVYNQSFGSVSGFEDEFETNVTDIDVGSYEWNCLFYDENDNSGLAKSNFSLTITNLEVNLISPLNGIITNENQSYSCNASSIDELVNVTFYLWNSSEEIVRNEIKNISGVENQSDFSFNFTYENDFEWNCLFENDAGIEGFASSNFSVTHDFTNPGLNATSPLNGSWLNVGKFNLTLSENGSCSYSLDSGSNNISMSSDDNKIFGAVNNSLGQGENHNVVYYCNDSAGNLNNSELISFNIDLTKPNVASLSPSDGHSATGTTSISFEYNVTDNLNITQCDLILNDGIVKTNASEILVNETNSISYSVSPGSYDWQVNCTDIAENVGNSSSRSLVINSASVSSSGGGGGGGGGTTVEGTVYVASAEQVSRGYSHALRKDDKIEFEIFDGYSRNHTLRINSVGVNFANITIQSDIVNFVLFVGENINLNLSSADYYDLFVKLEGIDAGKANLTIRAIKELIEVEEEMGEKEEEGSEKITGRGMRIINVMGVLVLVGVIVLTFYIYNRMRKRKDESGEKKEKKNFEIKR